MKRVGSAWLIVAAALVPLLLFAIFQVGYAAREQRRTIEARALNTADKLILAADAETVRYAVLLDALATTRALRTGDWSAELGRFEDFKALNPDLRGMVIADEEGRVLAKAGLPIVTGTFIADGRKATRPLFIGYDRTGDCRCLMFQRATTTGDGQSVVLTILTDSDQLLRLLPPAGKEFEVAAFNGPQGRFIARSIDQDKRFGTLGSAYLRRAVASGRDSGIYRGFTLEGFENYSAFARSERTGWTAHVALGSDYIDDPARRFLGSLIVAALLSLLLAALLIAFALRQMREARAFAERMQQAQKMEALGQLTGGLAHDFNNLLTPVVGVLDQLQRREELDERARRLATGALSSAQRAARLTQQLLAFSRKQKLTVEAVDVPALLAGLGELVERSYGGRHQFRIEGDAAVRCVRSDRIQLELALLNLAINARDASPEGSEIVLAVNGDEAGGNVRLAMIDRGSGMDEETKRRATEPFFTTKSVGRGTGLGLAQVFGLAEQSGGRVEINSEVGSGTVVALFLPACEEAELSAARQAAAERPSAPRHALRLLVVDDDPAVRATVSQVLTEAGHAVDAVSSGTTALAALAVEPFDLIVTDYAMPVMNGAELIDEARRVRPGVPALIVSGFADSASIERTCLETRILRKPFTTDELLAAVGECVSPAAG